MIYDFELRFALPAAPASEAIANALFEAGCDDATIGVGHPGHLGLMVSREASDAAGAIHSAISDVLSAFPAARLLEARPDLVTLTEAAEVFGCTRQAMRRYAVGEIRTATVPFPQPTHAGTTPLWRLADLLAWNDAEARFLVGPGLLALAVETARLNLAAQADALDRLPAPGQETGATPAEITGAAAE